jgi:glycosyltransferase involved in cell wall biosynthesis
VPVVLMEAMAAGVPVVATRIAGIPELVEHGESGLLVPPGDPAALADAIALLLESDGLRARFGAAGRAKVEREFNLRHEVARLVEIMTQALRGRVAPVRPDVTEGAPTRHPAP